MEQRYPAGECIFPFDMLGAVDMAVCMVYIMYKQYLFDFSYRVTVGAVYFLAVVVASLPLVILTHNLESVLGKLGRSAAQRLILFIVLQCAWTVSVVVFTRKRLDNILNQKQKHMLEGIHTLQDRYGVCAGGGHRCQGNVSQYAVLLAQKLGLSRDNIQTVKVAGLLHDIGKIGIPESILKKAGKLTNEEYEIMKSHVEKSIEMIHYLPNMNYVIPAVVSHHERYDGKGYPRDLKGEEIPLLGRILAVCDSFDARISKRAYKEALSVEYAMGELEKK